MRCRELDIFKILGIFWEFFGICLGFFGDFLGIFWGFFLGFFCVGLSVLYMVGITVGILYMMSHDTNCGYKKILGLRGDRTGQDKNNH